MTHENVQICLSRSVYIPTLNSVSIPVQLYVKAGTQMVNSMLHTSMARLNLNSPVQLAPSWNFQFESELKSNGIRGKKRQIKLQTVLKLIFHSKQREKELCARQINDGTCHGVCACVNLLHTIHSINPFP